MGWIQRDIGVGSDEEKEDRAAVVARLAKLPGLIERETNIEARRWLQMELIFLENNGHAVDWPQYKSHLVNIGRQEHAAQVKLEAAKAAEAKAVAAAQAELDAKIRAKIAEETDPVTLYKRAHSERTF